VRLRRSRGGFYLCFAVSGGMARNFPNARETL